MERDKLADKTQQDDPLYISNNATGYQMSSEERDRLLFEWNDTESEYPKDKCIHQLFEAQVERTPDAIAVVFEDKQLTYRELNQRAYQLAHHLEHLGVGPETLVGICVQRSLEMIIGLLGILKAGGAYVPLDPSYPAARLSFILEDSGARILVTQQCLIDSLPAYAGSLLCMDRDGDEIGRKSSENSTAATKAEGLAYVIYTSGSTGEPKGAMIEHRNTVAFLSWAHSAFTQEELSGVIFSTSICFDLSVFEIFAPLTYGGTVIIAKNVLALTAIPNSLSVTLLNAVPSAMTELLRFGTIPSSVQVINLAGEPLSSDLVRRICEPTPVKKVHDLYGPTECTTYSTWTCRTPDGPQTIGRPIANTQVYILDDHLNPVPIGVAGEIHIGGNGVARGYLNRPELTAEKFIRHSFDGERAQRLYKTGDRARYLPDGNIEFLGRIDDQVKIRGFRIELGEIEAVLVQHPKVQQTVVLAREDSPGDRVLVAYIVAAQHSDPSASELRGFLQQNLPDYMIPSVYIFFDSFPLTPNEKVDKKALPLPDPFRRDLRDTYCAPRTPIEETLATIWADVLKLAKVGIDDNFFALGGDSLRAVQIIARSRNALGKDAGIGDLLSNPTVAELASHLDQAIAEPYTHRATSIRSNGRSHQLPLSFSQERAWFIQQLYPSQRAYQFQSLLYFTGRLDVSALERSLSEIIRRHEIFRTTFPDVDGRPIQRIHPPFSISLPVIDLTGLHDHNRTEALQQRIAEETERTFNLNELPLVRWTLIRLDRDEYVLIHVEHHLVHDGWSFNIFRRELLELYKAFSTGKLSPLAEPSVQFADFAHWQREWMEGDEAKRQLAFWQYKLAESPTDLALPTDYPRPTFPSFRGAAPRFDISPVLGNALRALSRDRGVTLFMTMFSAFVVLLFRYSQEEDICVGAGVANRRWKESEWLIGMLVNNVVLRTDVGGNPRFIDLLTQVRSVTLDAYANEDIPFDQVVRALKIERDQSRNPLFQVMFSFHDAPLDEPTVSGIGFKCVEAISNRSAKFDMNVVVIPRPEQRLARREGDNDITLVWEYGSNLFDQSTINRMAGHFQTLLEGIVTNPEQPVSRLPLLTEAEKHRLLVEWNDTEGEYPKDECVHELFEAQVETTPDTLAVVFEDQQLTYRELNNRANQLAHYLIKLGVGPDVLVGVCMERCIEMIVGLLGTLKAGGAYVPLDPGYPKDRLELMLEDTNTSMILTDQFSMGSLPHTGRRLVSLTSDWDEIAREPQVNLSSRSTADSLAYVIYTSGSTGIPKGVEVRHRGVVRLLFGIDYVQLDHTQTILHLAPISFDAATFEIWGALLHGGKCVLFPGKVAEAKELEGVLKLHHVSTLWLTAALFNTVINEEPQTLSDVKQLLIGGEALSVPHVQRGLEQLPDTKIINGYGPTESTTFTCCYTIPRQVNARLTSIPIGKPIANTQVYILDAHLNPIPIGVAGEIHIGGDGLARGYLNRPELTKEKFIANPFSTDPSSRLYKSGDLARYLPDGNIEFLGRTDNQVKIRGYRIELGEIESVLAQHVDVRETVVIVKEDHTGDKQIIAYVVPRAAAPASRELRGYLKAKLPDYMVPSVFVILAALPLSPNGKVDRQALPPVDRDAADADVERGYVAPRNAVEEGIAAIWSEVFGIKQIGVRDNFFDLGGHSLKATQIVSRMRVACKCEIPLRHMFEYPSIGELAEAIKVLEEQQPAMPTDINRQARRSI